MEGGQIGTTKYPKTIEKCMVKARDSTVDELVKRYGLPDWQAKVLKDRATGEGPPWGGADREGREDLGAGRGKEGECVGEEAVPRVQPAPAARTAAP